MSTYVLTHHGWVAEQEFARSFVAVTCRACSDYGCDTKNGEYACPTCPVTRLYDKLAGNDEEGEAE